MNSDEVKRAQSRVNSSRYRRRHRERVQRLEEEITGLRLVLNAVSQTHHLC